MPCTDCNTSLLVSHFRISHSALIDVDHVDRVEINLGRNIDNNANLARKEDVDIREIDVAGVVDEHRHGL